MDIKLEQYRVFYVSANRGSFSEAAKSLFITQSAVSQQIKALEDSLGSVLFIRGRKGVTLTTQGTLLYSAAEQAINLIDDAESLFMRMKTLDEGELRIGAGDTITRHFLLPMLERFHYTYPGVTVDICNRVTSETLQMLVSGKVDIAFINLPVDEREYKSVNIRPIFALHDIFVAGSSFKYLAERTLSEADIASLPLVFLEPKSNTRRATDAYFLSKGIRLSPEFELGSYDLLFDFAKRNLGIACVTQEFTDNYGSDSGMFKLKTSFTLPERQIGVCTPKNITPSQAVAKLLEMVFA